MYTAAGGSCLPTVASASVGLTLSNVDEHVKSALCWVCMLGGGDNIRERGRLEVLTLPQRYLWLEHDLGEETVVMGPYPM